MNTPGTPLAIVAPHNAVVSLVTMYSEIVTQLEHRAAVLLSQLAIEQTQRKELHEQIAALKTELAKANSEISRLRGPLTSG